MNMKYTILAVLISAMSLVFARTSGNFNAFSDSFFDKAGSVNKTLILDDKSSQEEGSLKWKRRHKRRKKAPNRRPKRGK